LQGDVVSERLELMYQVSDLAVRVCAVGVVVGSEITVTRGRIGEQMPDDDQDRSGDRDEGFEFAASFDQPPVALAEEGAGFGSDRGGLAEHAFEVGVAFTGRASGGFGAGLDGART